MIVRELATKLKDLVHTYVDDHSSCLVCEKPATDPIHEVERETATAVPSLPRERGV